MATTGKSRFAILGMLASAPMSGYDIKKLTESSTRHFWTESYGNLYPTLARLEREGLVTSRVQAQQGKPDRKLYSITHEGRSTLREWLGKPATNQPVRNELLLKLFFGDSMPAETRRQHIERFRSDVRSRLETYDGISEWLEREHGQERALPYWLITLSYGQHVARALLEWSDEALRLLQRVEGVKEQL